MTKEGLQSLPIPTPAPRTATSLKKPCNLQLLSLAYKGSRVFMKYFPPLVDRIWALGFRV